MFEQFDENEKNEKIKQTAGSEFTHLKKTMALIQGKPHNGEFFNWTDRAPSGHAVLLLGEVAAQFIVRNGAYNVRFGQRPYAAYELSPGELVYPENWELTPDVFEGGFIWTIDGKRYSLESLAEAIAAKLAEFCDDFKEAAKL